MHWKALAALAVLATLVPMSVAPTATAHIANSVDSCSDGRLHVHIAFIAVVPILYCFSIPTMESGILLP